MRYPHPDPCERCGLPRPYVNFTLGPRRNFSAIRRTPTPRPRPTPPHPRPKPIPLELPPRTQR